MAKSEKSKKSSKISETKKEVVPLSPKEGFNTGPLESPSQKMAERNENFW